MANNRVTFGSKLGVVLATVGCAVGLGSVWRFPYMLGANGGAAFLLVYILFMIFLGIPVMITEFFIGRHSRSNTVGSFKKMAPGTKWCWIGYNGILAAFLILSYYSVVSGWTLEYVWQTLSGRLYGQPDIDYTADFQDFASNVFRPIFWMGAFIGLTHFVIVSGVEKGIERASKIMMPLLFLILLIMCVRSVTLPNAEAGLLFLFKPDFSKLTSSVVLSALGQAFFSLSLGTACLCTYASYFSRQTNLLKSASQIVVIDTLIAVLAGLMIFPAAFSVGVQPDSGPSLIFITLPNVFQQAFGDMPVVSYIISVLFYALLVLAALTSTISMHEIGTAMIYEERKITRAKGAWIETITCSIIAVFCSLSQGAVPGLGFFGKDFLTNCDNFTAQLLMPFASIVTCLFLGWYVPKKIVRDEFTNWGTVSGKLFPVFLFMIRFVSPICILLIFLHQFGVI